VGMHAARIPEESSPVEMREMGTKCPRVDVSIWCGYSLVPVWNTVGKTGEYSSKGSLSTYSSHPQFPLEPNR
jgi:hypothetical protein